MARQAFCDPGSSLDLDRLQRDQVRQQNMYQRALRGLALMRKVPNRTPQPAPEPPARLRNEPRDLNVCNTDPAPRPQPAPAPEPPSSRRAIPIDTRP